jgi:predicted methyltransferase
MRRRWKWLIGLAVVIIGAAVVAAVLSLPYLPVVHGTTDEEIDRLAEWLQIKPGAHVADLGAGDGRYAIALAHRVGPSGRVYATEIDQQQLARIRSAANNAGLTNVRVIEGAVARTNLPDGCCDALFSRNVYHHLSDAAAINADIFRALRPGGRLLVIDFEPGGILDLVPHGGDRRGGHGTRKETMVKEVTAAGFRHVRGPEAWRGRMYAVLFTRP